MGMFGKNEKKIRKEFSKKNTARCRETVKEIQELYDDLKTNYEDIEDVVETITEYLDGIKEKLDAAETDRLEKFMVKVKRVDKCARDAVRDVRDLLRTQKKQLKETLHDE